MYFFVIKKKNYKKKKKKEITLQFLESNRYILES